MEEVFKVVGPAIGVYSVLILCIILGAIAICCLQRYKYYSSYYSIPRIMTECTVYCTELSLQCGAVTRYSSVTPGTLGCLKIQSSKIKSMPVVETHALALFIPIGHIDHTFYKGVCFSITVLLPIHPNCVLS